MYLISQAASITNGFLVGLVNMILDTLALCCDSSRIQKIFHFPVVVVVQSSSASPGDLRPRHNKVNTKHFSRALKL